MAKKKIEESDVETVEPLPKKPGLTTVEAKHVVTYTQPITVPVKEDDADLDDDLDEIDEEETERAKPRTPSLRTRLRDKLSKNGIADTEQLRLRIDRLPLYDQNGQAGINAEKEFLRTTTCTESFFTSDEYLDHIRAIGGPGTYWLTLRHKNNIVASWQERIGGAPQTETTMTGEVVSVQSNGQVDPSAMMDAFMRHFEKFQKLQNAMMPPWIRQMNPAELMQSSAQPVPATTESALLTLLNADDELLQTAVGKLRKVFRGDGAIAEEKGPWDAVVAALTSPTLPAVVSQVIASFRQQQPVENPATQPQPQQPPPDVAAYQIVIRRLIDSLKLNGEVENVIAAIDGFLNLFPQHQMSVEGLINLPPEQALQMLAQVEPMAAEAVALPHAVEWIQRLRDAYFQPGDNPDGLNQ